MRSKKQAAPKFAFQGVSFDKWDIDRAYRLCRCLTNVSFEALAAQEECSVEDVEEVAEDRFQSLAWNLKLDPKFLFEATIEYSCHI